MSKSYNLIFMPVGLAKNVMNEAKFGKVKNDKSKMQKLHISDLPPPQLFLVGEILTFDKTGGICDFM